MEKLAGTITNEADLAMKAQGCLDQLATKCFDNLTSKNKVLGTDGENLWTGTVNCQTYAKELVKELKCEWPEEVNVFVEKYLIGNVIIHVKRETEYTFST
jgi:hypothetical protein